MIHRLQPPLDIEQICAEGTKADEAVDTAARNARLRHKQMGVPIVVWQDGQIVEIPPEEIVVDPPETKP